MKKNQDHSSGFQLHIAGVLVENTSYIQKQTRRKIRPIGLWGTGPRRYVLL